MCNESGSEYDIGSSVRLSHAFNVMKIILKLTKVVSVDATLKFTQFQLHRQ